MYSVRQLEDRDKYEKKIKICQEQENILTRKLGYATNETEKMKKKYFIWLTENKITGLNFKP